MENKNCFFCESNSVELVKKLKIRSLPDGTEFKFTEEQMHCHECDAVFDILEKNEAFEIAYETAKKASLENICESLSAKGMSMAVIERSFRLPQRTITRWKSQGCSASGLALMSLVNLFPWLTQIADNNYDRSYAARELISQTGEVVSDVLKKANMTVTGSVFRNNNSGFSIITSINPTIAGAQDITVLDRDLQSKATA